MTEERLALSELLEKAGDGDFLRSVAEAVLQLLMEADVEGLIGAGDRYRALVASGRPGATATCDRVFDTRLGSLQLRIPKLPSGELLPAVPGSAEGLGEGYVDRNGGDPRGVDRGCFDAARRRSGAGDGSERDRQVASLQAACKKTS